MKPLLMVVSMRRTWRLGLHEEVLMCAEIITVSQNQTYSKFLKMDPLIIRGEGCGKGPCDSG